MSLPEALEVARQIEAKERRCNSAQRWQTVREALDLVIDAAELTIQEIKE